MLLAVAVGLGVSGCTVSQAARDPGGASQVLLVCNGSTVKCPAGSYFSTVQPAVDAARPGDWILIWPGVYHEHDAPYHAGIWITTPGLHIRGLSRTGVIIDGSHGSTRQPCPSSPSLQDYAPTSGIVVWQASDVTIQNLTVCDYLSGPENESGNQIWWDGGDGTGHIGMHGFTGSYLTATSMYHPMNVKTSGLSQYGIYVANSSGPGSITNSYASNMAAGAFYLGACRQLCDAALSDDYGTNSAFGYLGTNSGGPVVIKDSTFDNNRTGMSLSSLNNDDGPPPQDGRCPANPVRSCMVIEDNKIDNNNNANAPSNKSRPSIGVGVDLQGGQYDTVADNVITGNNSWGVVADDSVSSLDGFPFSRCQGGFLNEPAKGLCVLPARGNLIFHNYFSDDGSFGNPGNADVATIGLLPKSADPRNCFYANQVQGGPLTSVPAGIERRGADGEPCDKAGTGNDATLLAALSCAASPGMCSASYGRYPARTRTDDIALPTLPGMPYPCTGLPANAFCRALSKP